MRSWTNAAVTVSVLALISLACALGGCAANKCAGDSPGAMNSDGEFFVTFDKVSLSKPGKYSYRIENLPSSNLLAFLDVQSADFATREAIDRAGVRVNMTIRSERFSSEPVQLIVRDGRLEGDWTKTPESWNDASLEYIASTFRPKRHQVYTITLEVFPGDKPVQDVWAAACIREATSLAANRGREAMPADENPAWVPGTQVGHVE